MNLPKFLSFINRVLLAFAVVAVVGISACDEDEPDGPQVFDGTIMDLIQSDDYKQSEGAPATEALDSLVKYLTLYPSLTAKLSGSTEYTLFAPSNAAFIGLLATPNFPQNIKLISPTIIENVFSYHIVEGKKMKADLTAGATLTSEFTDPMAPGAAQTITVNSNGTLKAAPNSTNTDIDIVKSDLQTSNGVVHIIESVMIPPSTGAVLTPILGTIAGTVLLGKDFSNLAKVILAADAGFTENPATGTFKVSTWLAMPISNATTVTANQKGFTFFAPPNAISPTVTVFTEAMANALIASPDKGRSFLLNHLVTTKQYTVADPPATNPNGITKFTTGQIVPASGETKTITVVVGAASAQNPFGVALSNTPAEPASFRPIVSKDLVHSNGMIQVFAGGLN